MMFFVYLVLFIVFLRELPTLLELMFRAVYTVYSVIARCAVPIVCAVVGIYFLSLYNSF
jgi:hypothetical protein